MTVGDFYDLINQIAPFDTQMEFDNSGDVHFVCYAKDAIRSFLRWT